jgi:hypothetical protein
MQHIAIDWQKCLLNLRRHEPLAKIANQIGADPATLQRIARGETIEPRFTTGIQLLNIHLDLEPGKHRQLYRSKNEQNKITKSTS